MLISIYNLPINFDNAIKERFYEDTDDLAVQLIEMLPHDEEKPVETLKETPNAKKTSLFTYLKERACFSKRTLKIAAAAAAGLIALAVWARCGYPVPQAPDFTNFLQIRDPQITTPPKEVYISPVQHIKGLIEDIKGASVHWNHREIVTLQGKDASIAVACQTILEMVKTYYQNEKSPDRQMELLGDLSHVLWEWAVKVGRKKTVWQQASAQLGYGLSDSEKQIWDLIQQVENYKNKGSEFSLSKIETGIQEYKVSDVHNNYLSKTKEQKITQFKESAFRAVRDIGLFEKDLLKSVGGLIDVLAFRSILNDVELFILEFGERLTDFEKKILVKLQEQLKFAEEI